MRCLPRVPSTLADGQLWSFNVSTNRLFDTPYMKVVPSKLMDIKTFIKQFIPPILLELYRNRTFGTRYVWEGIYLHYNDMPTIGPGFACDRWVNSAVTEAQDAIAISKRYGSIPMEVIEEYALLPMLASLAHQRNGRQLRILEFGR